MPGAKYKVMAVGPQIAATATAPVFVSIAGVAKKVLPNQPFIVANELVCCNVARALLLPCPPGALMESGADTYFFSLDFNLAGQALPPVSPSAIVQVFPDLAWGIIVFDALIMNTDRHSHNIAHDTVTDRIQIFDHSHAYLTPGGDIDQTLAARSANLAIGGHCLAGEINTATGLDSWIEKAKQIPDYFIDGIVEAGCGCGIPPDRKDLLASFMKNRRDNLGSLFSANMANFPKVPTP
jgi:hypothetical protein